MTQNVFTAPEGRVFVVCQILISVIKFYIPQILSCFNFLDAIVKIN